MASLRRSTVEARAVCPFHVQPSPVAAATVSPSGRHVAHADLGLAVDLERDQHTKQRHASDEALGAVDGIDDPAKRRPAAVGAVLFADHRVVRVPRGNRLPDQLLGAAIGARDRRGVGLELDGDPGLIVLEGHTARVERDLKREGEVLVEGTLIVVA